MWLCKLQDMSLLGAPVLSSALIVISSLLLDSTVIISLTISMVYKSLPKIQNITGFLYPKIRRNKEQLRFVENIK